MNSRYRNVALAAGGMAAVAVAASLLRRRTGPERMTAQTMTIAQDAQRVIDALADGTILARALDCAHDVALQFSPDGRTVEWFDEQHPERAGRMAFIAAPGDRGTEVHVAMHGKKYDVKDVVRRLKSLVEAGEISTGAWY